MKPRIFIGCASIIPCLAMLAGVFARQRQLADLRSDQERLLAQAAAPPDNPSAASAAPATEASTLELLRLRNQVNQLTEQRRELAQVFTENKRLHAQLAGRGTNASSGADFPPGYIRRSQARWVGLDTPENTLQSFLWTLQNRDLTNLFQILTEKSGQRIMQQMSNSPDFFQDAGVVPGMRIVSQQTLPDGNIEAKVEIVPGELMPQSLHFQWIGGQWKLDIF